MLILFLLFNPSLYAAGFCNYNCGKESFPDTRDISKRPYRPDRKKLRKLQALLSTFSAKFDRFETGDLPDGYSYQEFFTLSQEIIQILSEHPGIIRVLPLAQLTGFFQRTTLDTELFSEIEDMFISLERDLLTYLERQGLGQSAWESPSDINGWKQGLKTANDMLLLLAMHRQFVEEHDDGGIMEIMDSLQERLARAVLSGCELISTESPQELDQFLEENSNRKPGHSFTRPGQGTSEFNENLPLFEPIYGRYGLVGELVAHHIRKSKKSGSKRSVAKR